MNPLLKLAVEIGPLVLFVGIVFRYDIWLATKAFMVAFIIAMGVAFYVERRISAMFGVTGGLVLIFGGLTLLLADETFIKMKPTAVYLLMASILTAGLVRRRLYVRMLMQEAVQFTEAGWRSLTVRLIAFFVFAAVLNEVVWRSASTEFWAAFKIWGLMPLSMIYMAAQFVLLRKEMILDGHPAKSGSGDSG